MNPLALQKELHRQLLRAQLGIKSAPEAELTEREQVVAKHLEKMMQSEDAQKLGAEYLAHLRQAKEAANTAVISLKTPLPRIHIGSPYGFSASALDHLIKAAQIEAAAEQEEKERGDGEPSDSPPETKYSLIKPPSEKSDKDAEAEEKKDEAIAKAANALEQLRKEQEQLNKDAGKLDESKDGEKPGDAKDGEKPGDKPGSAGVSPAPGKQPGDKPGESPGQGQSPGQPGQPGGKPGQQQGQPSDQKPGQPPQAGQQPPPSAAQLAAQQAAMSTTTGDILKGMENLERKDRQADPKQVADALRTAKEFQQKTAEALRSANLAQAKQFGAKSAEALDAATVLTKSLLEKQVRQSIEAQSPAPGFETLIQDYSRRISYD